MTPLFSFAATARTKPIIPSPSAPPTAPLTLAASSALLAPPRLLDGARAAKTLDFGFQSSHTFFRSSIDALDEALHYFSFASVVCPGAAKATTLRVLHEEHHASNSRMSERHLSRPHTFPLRVGQAQRALRRSTPWPAAVSTPYKQRSFPSQSQAQGAPVDGCLRHAAYSYLQLKFAFTCFQAFAFHSDWSPMILLSKHDALAYSSQICHACGAFPLERTCYCRFLSQAKLSGAACG